MLVWRDVMMLTVGDGDVGGDGGRNLVQQSSRCRHLLLFSRLLRACSVSAPARDCLRCSLLR